MSDLISRSELLKRFYVNKDGHRIPERDCDNFEVTVSIKDVKTIIKEQPTAYDIDKVVEELEKLQTYNMSCVTLMSDLQRNGVCRHYICLEDAIKIVKQGGVSNDVCEWKQTSTAKYKTSCGYKLEEHFDTNACYCKQCGKKIKVVE